MRDKILVAALVLITAAYCWGLGWIGWGFLRAGGILGYGLALGVAILLGLTVWVTWREVLFGLAAGGLARRYSPPADAVAGDAGAEFAAARAAIELDLQVDRDGQDDWRAWFRLALAYDALRDRKGARMASRRAIDARRDGAR